MLGWLATKWKKFFGAAKQKMPSYLEWTKDRQETVVPPKRERTGLPNDMPRRAVIEVVRRREKKRGKIARRDARRLRFTRHMTRPSAGRRK